MSRRKPTKHGTLHAYIDHKCRCDSCRENIVEYRKKKAQERYGSQDTPHGTITGYSNYDCRCNDCRATKAEYSKRYTQTPEGRDAINKAGKRWRNKNSEKTRAQDKVHKAIKKGLLVRPNICEHCGVSTFIEASHTDYTRPLDVEWLCYWCHRVKDGLAGEREHV